MPVVAVLWFLTALIAWIWSLPRYRFWKEKEPERNRENQANFEASERNTTTS